VKAFGERLNLTGCGELAFLLSLTCNPMVWVLCVIYHIVPIKTAASLVHHQLFMLLNNMSSILWTD